MDFIRAAIKSLFYKYPLAQVAECIINKHPNNDLFLTGLKEVLRWDTPQFTTTEIKVLENVIDETWMKPFKREFTVDGIPPLGKALFVLFHLGNDVFDTSSWLYPTIQFDHLLRWRDIAYYVGEDIVTIPFLAEQDSVRLYDRASFVWENVIRHNNKELNKIIDKGLSEVHSHVNAAIDVFELNWIRLMNEVCIDLTKMPIKQRNRLGLEDYRQDFSPTLWNSKINMTLHDWGIVAASIRTKLYCIVMKEENVDLSDLNKMIEDKIFLYEQEKEIVATIGTFATDAYRLPNGLVFDYAITNSSVRKCNEEEIRKPYFVHQGERELLYRYFRLFIENVNRVKAFSQYVYLYLLIKNNYRREFIQTNPLNGFENFQRYQKRKSLYLNNDEINRRVNFRYAIQTSMRDIEGEKLEMRLAPEQVEKRLTRDYQESIFQKECLYQRQSKNDCLSFVVHFIKKPDVNKNDNISRHAAYRTYLQEKMRMIVNLCKEKPTGIGTEWTKIVGIDAAGSELDCRPEVFAPSFRYAQLSGLNNITYHAGEDFYDLIDGLRTIDEVLLFMNYQRGCRIGHALALGIIPKRYYKSRHRNTIMPQQVMLDNLVWLYYKARQMNVELCPDTLEFIDNQTYVLYQGIGYDGEFDKFVYWQSMLLRGDSPENRENGEQELTIQERASKCHHPLCDNARLVKRAKELRVQYDRNINVKTKGSQPKSFVLPESIITDIEALQEKMLDDIEKRGIYIECNPTSNLKIGPFERYDELPLWRFHNVRHPKRHSINISINTDDKGVFSTSLYNEYSVIALAMLKKKNVDGNLMWTPKEVMDYIEHIVEMSHSQRFDPVKVWLAE